MDVLAVLGAGIRPAPSGAPGMILVTVASLRPSTARSRREGSITPEFARPADPGER